MFDDYIVLEFVVSNTLENVILGDVTVTLEIESGSLQVMQVISANQIKTGEKASIFITVAKDPEVRIAPSNIIGYLKYKVTEFSGKNKTAEYDDEYQLEDVKISLR